jgi:hypothetical protein
MIPSELGLVVPRYALTSTIGLSMMPFNTCWESQMT